MFGKLKEKLKNWASKISSEKISEEISQEEISHEDEVKPMKIVSSSKKKKEKEISKKKTLKKKEKVSKEDKIPPKEEKITLNDKEYHILYMCDDSVGFIELMEGELNLNEKEVKKIINFLVKKELIETSALAKPIQYFTTQKGKDYLKKTVRQIKTPLKFNEGVGQYQPDTEKIKEIEESVSPEGEEPFAEAVPSPKEKKEISSEISPKKSFLKKIFSKKEPTSEEVKTSAEVKSISEEIEKAPLEKELETPKSRERFFHKIVSKINKTKISEKDFNGYAEELELLLLENNVAFEVVDKIIAELKIKIVDHEFLKKEIFDQIRYSLRDIIEDILINPYDLVKKIKDKGDEPFVILFCGINGTGKTTTIAKIANLLKENNLSSAIAAGDTFRAASIEQIKIHGEKLGVPVISSEYGADPTSVAFDAIKYAKKNNIKCVLIDTAGRMHTAKNLLAEIEKIARVCKPDEKIFVGESITGNDATEQVKAFDEAVGLTSIILSKADIDEKGGTALSVGFTSGKPILFLGVGQEYDKLEKFDKEKFVHKLGLS